MLPQGVGVFLNNQHVGTFGDIGILSYYGNKTITCGEGGIVLTNNEQYYKNCYKLKNHGREKKGVFIHEDIGFNFSFTEIGTIGISQMEKLDKIICRKKNIHDVYVDNLKNVGDIKFQEFSDGVSPVHWFTSFFTNKKTELMKFLLENNIQTREFFYPLHLQPCYKNILDVESSFDISERLYNTGVSLPSSYNLSDDELIYIINKIKEFYNEYTISK